MTEHEGEQAGEEPRLLIHGLMVDDIAFRGHLNCRETTQLLSLQVSYTAASLMNQLKSTGLAFEKKKYVLKNGGFRIIRM